MNSIQRLRAATHLGFNLNSGESKQVAFDSIFRRQGYDL
jgi:hypothetical protein